MTNNIKPTQCNSTISVFEHQMLLEQRLFELHGYALIATNEGLVDNPQDIKTNKVISMFAGVHSAFRLVNWNEDDLSLLSRYLTKEEKALLIYATYSPLDAQFVLKYEDIHKSLFDKITHYLGIIVLGLISFNGIAAKFNTLDLFKGLRDIDEIEPQEVDTIFVKSMMFKQSKEYHRHWFKETWDEILETNNHNIHPMFKIIIDIFGLTPQDVTSRDMLIIMRTKLGLTQREFAERYCVPLGTYNHWEQGVRKPLDYVMCMLYSLVADDLVFAESHDLHSVYSVLSSYAVDSASKASPYVCIETSDGVIIENKDSDFTHTTIKDSFFSKHVFSLVDILLKYPDIVVLEHSFIQLDDNVSILKVKLDVSSTEYESEFSIVPKILHSQNVFENETFDFICHNHIDDVKTIDAIMSRAYSYLIDDLQSSLKHYMSIEPINNTNINIVMETIYPAAYEMHAFEHLLVSHYCIDASIGNQTDIVRIWANNHMCYNNTDAAYIFDKFNELYDAVHEMQVMDATDDMVSAASSMQKQLSSDGTLMKILNI